MKWRPPLAPVDQTTDGVVTTTATYNSMEDRLIVRTSQDVEPVLDENKRLYNDGDGYSPSREMRRVASIPMVVVTELNHRGIMRGTSIVDHDAFKRFINDPENLYLRTAPGTV